MIHKPEPFDIGPIDLGALTAVQRDNLYADAVRRAHLERSDAIRGSAARHASMLKKSRRTIGAVVLFAGIFGAAVISRHMSVGK
ncbi:hypothetical protein [Mesorhizobium sp. Cs1299R1N3]|uniref:hypothetical protein n=1 Tax=Mesorhizobium sp. Cs1299R1N3 TaxID=3015173 RepID=UPI00301C3B42